MTCHPITTCFIATFIATSLQWTSKADQLDVWLGTGGAPSRGIYHTMLDTETGRLSASRLVAEIRSPGFLAKHPRLPILYAVGAFDREDVVASYRIQGTGSDAQLELIGYQPIGDGNGTHLAVSRDGRTLLTVQYGSGSVAAFPLDDEGKIGQRTALVRHQGGSRVDPTRQEAPHAHWVGFSPDQKFALVPDLGLDEVVLYRVATDSAVIELHGAGVVPPGAGPRHMRFHPNGKWIYVLNELDLTVSLFDWDAEEGAMKLRQTLSTVPQEELQPLSQKSCSEIRVHPNGKFVYAANRGHDSITVFSVGDDGTLSTIQNEAVRGANPRNFNLDPSGKWLLVGGQDSHTLASFAVDPETGKLIFSHNIISTPTPICVLFGHE